MEDQPHRPDPRIERPLLTPGWVPTYNDPDNCLLRPSAEPVEYGPGERAAIEAEHAHFAQYYRNDL